MRDYKLYIEDILEAVSKIKRYTKDMNFDEFCENEQAVDAVFRNFEVVGEAARQLPEDIKAQYEKVEWRAIIAFRNVIAHEYFGIDMEIMWDIVENKLDALEENLSV